MVVNSTEVKKDFQKYLLLAAKEDIIITNNGMEIARLKSMEGNPRETIQEGIIRESGGTYPFKGRKASYGEFLELTRDEEYIRYEYIDGEIYLLATPRVGHQFVVTQLLASFYQWSEEKGCMTFTAPYDIKLNRRNSENPCVVQPDLFVICNLDDHLDERGFYTGVPELVVEVLSESTRNKDMIKKLDLYKDCAVQEYWIVDSENEVITIYEFENNKVKNTRTYQKKETAESFRFEGLKVDVEQIFM